MAARYGGRICQRSPGFRVPPASAVVGILPDKLLPIGVGDSLLLIGGSTIPVGRGRWWLLVLGRGGGWLRSWLRLDIWEWCW